MPRSDFGPEVKAGMQGNANTPVRGGVPRTGPRQPPSPGSQVREQGADSSGNTGLPPVSKMPGPGRGGMPGMSSGPRPAGPIRPPTGGVPSGAGDIPHVAAAASIAHAILGNRGLR